MTTVEQQAGIRPFHVEIPEEALADLRRRLAATRWPSPELVADRSQGVQLATMQALARYWSTEYDLRRVETRLNALPQFTTEIDGVDIHFLHVRSPHQDALPLIMTHGWPGSVIELLEIVGPLTAAWMLDHDTDAYYKMSRAFVDGKPVGNLTRDHLLDNITLNWLTGTGASSARWYWETRQAQAAAQAAGGPLRRWRSRSASRRSPARSSPPRAAGSRRSTPASPTSTRPTGAATSPPGKNRSSSPPKCGPHSAHCADGASVLDPFQEESR